MKIWNLENHLLLALFVLLFLIFHISNLSHPHTSATLKKLLYWYFRIQNTNEKNMNWEEKPGLEREREREEWGVERQQNETTDLERESGCRLERESDGGKSRAAASQPFLRNRVWCSPRSVLSHPFLFLVFFFFLIFFILIIKTKITKYLFQH